MTSGSDDRLRQFGDRLDWVYPVEGSDELLGVIAPLFVRDVVPAEAPASPSRPVRPALRAALGR